MKIYNTYSRTKEDFVPGEQGKAKIYVCGPTVYSYVHIGNARPIVVFDALRRYLLYKGFDVTFVSNFTDIDDRIISRANDEGVDYSVISNRYIDAALNDSDKLNVLRADHYPKATEEIDGIIAMITELISKGYAYEKNGSVFFSTSKFADYGRLSGKKISELTAGARVEVDDEKQNPMDFVLWKPAKPGEPKWSSPWGDGRPGWHIECSVMSKKYLGDTIDIHAGGDDLVFPHHENELAQSEAANGKQFVRYWMHNGMLQVDNHKMAKSEGNFIRVCDITKEFSYDALRFSILSVHYRSPFNFSRELMTAAEASLLRIRNCYAGLKYELENAADSADFIADNISAELSRFKKRFCDSLEDDLNTANAITAIFELVKFANLKIADKLPKAGIEEILTLFDELCGIMGIKLSAEMEINEADIEALIAERQAARNSRDYAASDRIRDELMQKGIILNDTPEGVKWIYKGKV